MTDDDSCCPQKDMNFRMPKSFHTRFKVRAAQDEIEMRELLVRAFEAYEKYRRPKS